MKRLFLILVLSFAAGAAGAQDDSLFRSLGGREGIQKFTRDFVEIVYADPRIRSFFQKTDKQRLEAQLVEQFCELAGGPCRYGGRSMKEVHARMGVQNAHFNALAEDLQIAMERAGVPNREANRLVAKLAPMQRDIVEKK